MCLNDSECSLKVPSLIETVNQITQRIVNSGDLSSAQKNELAEEWMSKVLFDGESSESSDVYRQIFKNYKETIDNNNAQIDQLRNNIETNEFKISVFGSQLQYNSDIITALQSDQTNQQLLDEAKQNLTDYIALREPELEALRDEVDNYWFYWENAVGWERYWKEVSVEVDGYLIALTSIGSAFDAVANSFASYSD